MEGECQRIICYLQGYSCHKPYWNKPSNNKSVGHTICSTRRTIYPECRARFNNFHSSNILSLYLSLSFWNKSYLSKITKLFTFFGKNAVLNMCRYLKRFYAERKNSIFLKFLHACRRMPKIIEIVPAENITNAYIKLDEWCTFDWKSCKQWRSNHSNPDCSKIICFHKCTFICWRSCIFHCLLFLSTVWCVWCKYL